MKQDHPGELAASNTTTVTPAAGALLVRDGRVLLCLRSASRRSYPAVWDVPGGHVEPGETLAAALKRELAEELEIVIPEPMADPLAHVVDAAAGIDLMLWVLTDWIGEARNVCLDEHDAVVWFTPAEAIQLPLAHASYPSLIMRAIALSAQ